MPYLRPSTFLSFLLKKSNKFFFYWRLKSNCSYDAMQKHNFRNNNSWISETNNDVRKGAMKLTIKIIHIHLSIGSLVSK